MAALDFPASPTVNQLATLTNGFTYQWDGAAGTTDGTPGISFIADEVESVMSEMVGTQRAKLQPDDEDDVDLKTLDVSPMLFAFVNAFKELAARVATLEAK